MKSLDDVRLAGEWLQSGQHNFRSVTLDSLSELQKQIIYSVAGDNAPDQQQWGDILRKAERIVRLFRDLRASLDNPTGLAAVIYVAATKDYGGSVKPFLQGGLADVLPYIPDVIGYLYADRDPEGNVCRRLLIQPVPPFLAGDRTDVLSQHYGTTINNPNLAEMVSVLNPQKELASV